MYNFERTVYVWVKHSRIVEFICDIFKRGEKAKVSALVLNEDGPGKMLKFLSNFLDFY